MLDKAPASASGDLTSDNLLAPESASGLVPVAALRTVAIALRKLLVTISYSFIEIQEQV